jgi:hypothetical protein
MIWKAGESEKYSKKKKRVWRKKKKRKEEYIYHSYKTKEHSSRFCGYRIIIFLKKIEKVFLIIAS